jgi:hypothetical protein
MTQIIMDHGVSWCFGTGLAPRNIQSTRGLGISDSPTSDNLKPQQTTEQAPRETGPDGAGLPCLGSSVVAVRQSLFIRAIQDRAKKQAGPTSDDPPDESGKGPPNWR